MQSYVVCILTLWYLNQFSGLDPIIPECGLWGSLIILGVINLLKDKFSPWIEGCESFYRLSIWPFKCTFVSYGCVMILSWFRHDVTSLLCIFGFLFNITLLTVNIALCSWHDLLHWNRRILGEGFIKLTRLHTSLKCPNEHLLNQAHHLDCSVVKLGDVFS